MIANKGRGIVCFDFYIFVLIIITMACHDGALAIEHELLRKLWIAGVIAFLSLLISSEEPPKKSRRKQDDLAWIDEIEIMDAILDD